MRRWPAPLALALRRARKKARTPRGRTPVPPWIVLPVDLHDAYRSRGSRLAPSFLADVLWGQYCLFQCIRLQDDVFDRHTTDLALIYVSDQFLVEADRAFAPHFVSSSRFWEVFRGSVESTTRAIVETDALQQRVGCAPARLGRAYARVGAIFKVAVIAVCIAHRRTRDVPALGRFLDDYMTADQILDDLDDVDDDLRRARFNYVAQRLCARRVASNVDTARRAIARALAVGDGAERVLGDARRHFARALATAARLRVPSLSALVTVAEQSVDDRRRAFHRAQVRELLRQKA